MSTIPHTHVGQPLSQLPQLLNDAADTLLRNTYALPGPTDVRAALAAATRNRRSGLDAPAADAAWREVERCWATDSWINLASVEAWAIYLRYTALRIGGTR